MTNADSLEPSGIANAAKGADRGTPYVAVDYARMMRNIQLMQDRAARHGVCLRPHVKTHKCLEIARLQIAAGAVGLTASKPDEALAFINDGVESLIVAYPVIDPQKLDRLIRAARKSNTEIALIADSEEGVAAIQTAATRHHLALPVYLKIDVGLGRVGVSPGDARLFRVAESIIKHESLVFAGLLSHAGHAYAAASIADVQSIGRREAALLGDAIGALEDELRLETPNVSVGATPTALADAIYAPATEIRPGNYVFSDLTQLRIGVCSADDLALSIVSSVISVRDDHYIIDAGSKVLSSDLGPHGTGSGDRTYGMATTDDGERTQESWLPVDMLSEEHGFVRRRNSNFAVGARLRIFPKHSCSVVNLADWLVVEREGKPHSTWAVAARGKVQ